MEKKSVKEIIKQRAKLYFIDSMGAMALGLFASLLIGTIFTALGMIPGLEILKTIGGYAQKVAGPAMAAAIAYAMGGAPLVIFSSAAVGLAANELGGAGGPLAVFFITIVAVELGKLVSKKTKVDIIVTPFVTILSSRSFRADCSRCSWRRISARSSDISVNSSAGRPFRRRS